MHDYREADLSRRERALCDFAVKLTHLAAEVDRADIDALRAQRLDDATISDAIQVIGYFNYVTRVVDGSGSKTSWSGVKPRRRGSRGSPSVDRLALTFRPFSAEH